MLTLQQEQEMLDMLELHKQRMKTHAWSHQMEKLHAQGQTIDSPGEMQVLRQQHDIAAAKCGTIIENIIKKIEKN